MKWHGQQSDGAPSAPPPPDTAGSTDVPSAPPAPQQHDKAHTAHTPEYPDMLPVSSSSPFAGPAAATSPPLAASTATPQPYHQPQTLQQPQVQYGQPSGNDTSINMPQPGFYSWPYNDRYSSAPASSSAGYGDGSGPVEYSGYAYGAYTPSGYVDDNSAPLLGPSYSHNDLQYANRQVRHGFLRKVLGLLTVQLLLTAAIGGTIAFNKAAHEYMNTNLWVLWLATVLSFTVLIVLACSEDARRRHPTNLLLLLVFTAAEGVLVGAVTASFDTQVVLLAIVVTAAVTLALVVYALQTTVDFTVTGGVLYSALLIMLMVSLANLFFHWRTLDLLISGCGALLFSAYLVFDVQMVASGEHSFQIGADEYVYAALNVYIDCINIFIEVLRIIQQLQGSED